MVLQKTKEKKKTWASANRILKWQRACVVLIFPDQLSSKMGMNGLP